MQRTTVVDLTRSLRIIEPEMQAPEQSGDDQSKDSQEGVFTIQPIRARNVLPTDVGYRSFFGIGDTGRAHNGLAGTDLYTVLHYESAEGKNVSLFLTSHGLFYTSTNEMYSPGDSHADMVTSGALTAWESKPQDVAEFIHGGAGYDPTDPDNANKARLNHEIQATQVVQDMFAAASVEDADRSQHWSYMVLKDDLYLYRSGDPYALRIVRRAASPDGFQVQVLRLNFLDMSQQRGLFRAGGSLGFWDSAQAISVSSVLSPIDSVPDTKTLANVGGNRFVNGSIITVKAFGSGYMIYATGSVTEVRQDKGSILRWSSIARLSNVGVQDPFHVAVAQPDTLHFAWTSMGCMQFVAGSDPSPIISDIFDGLRGVYIRLALVGGRFLCVQYPAAGVDLIRKPPMTHVVDPADLYLPAVIVPEVTIPGISVDGSSVCLLDELPPGAPESGIKPHVIMPRYEGYIDPGYVYTHQNVTLDNILFPNGTSPPVSVSALVPVLGSRALTLWEGQWPAQIDTTANEHNTVGPLMLTEFHGLQTAELAGIVDPGVIPWGARDDVAYPVGFYTQDSLLTDVDAIEAVQALYGLPVGDFANVSNLGGAPQMPAALLALDPTPPGYFLGTMKSQVIDEYTLALGAPSTVTGKNMERRAGSVTGAGIQPEASVLLASPTTSTSEATYSIANIQVFLDVDYDYADPDNPQDDGPRHNNADGSVAIITATRYLTPVLTENDDVLVAFRALVVSAGTAAIAAAALDDAALAIAIGGLNPEFISNIVVNQGASRPNSATVGSTDHASALATYSLYKTWGIEDFPLSGLQFANETYTAEVSYFVMVGYFFTVTGLPAEPTALAVENAIYDATPTLQNATAGVAEYYYNINTHPTVLDPTFLIGGPRFQETVWGDLLADTTVEADAAFSNRIFNYPVGWPNQALVCGAVSPINVPELIIPPITFPEKTISIPAFEFEQAGQVVTPYALMGGSLIYDLQYTKWGAMDRMQGNYLLLPSDPLFQADVGYEGTILDLRPINGEVLQPANAGFYNLNIGVYEAGLQHFHESPELDECEISYGKFALRAKEHTTLESIDIKCVAPGEFSIIAQSSIDGDRLMYGYSAFILSGANATHATLNYGKMGAWHQISITGQFNLRELTLQSVIGSRR